MHWHSNTMTSHPNPTFYPWANANGHAVAGVTRAKLTEARTLLLEGQLLLDELAEDDSYAGYAAAHLQTALDLLAAREAHLKGGG